MKFLRKDMEMDKRNIAVIFGGQSTEHEVSCMSVVNVASNIDTDKWEVILIGITKEGRWLLAESLDSVKDGSWRESEVTAEISPDAVRKSVLITTPDGKAMDVELDIVFPVLHGKFGEDGTIQGLLEMAGIPYVGCGVLSSAVSMDKFYTKIIVEKAGIRQAAYVGIRREDIKDEAGLVRAADNIAGKLGCPVFIKPSRAGSSVGVTKASDKNEIIEGLKKAAKVDSKILVEEFIEGHEVECAVFGGGDDEVRAAGVGEILAAAEFYDYDAKYNNPESKTVLDADLPEDTKRKIMEDAVEIFKAVDGYGLSRVDFFVTRDNEVIFNEINTMPGFTAISMYPMLWENRGVSKKELVEMLIENGLKRDMG